VKLRLHGTVGEVAEATRRLVQVLDVVSVSDPYPDRGPACGSGSTSRSAWTTRPATGTTGR
jgi:hypothetical protein